MKCPICKCKNEELARELYIRFDYDRYDKRGAAKPWEELPKDSPSYCVMMNHAKKLIQEGYRKHPSGGLVLLDEEKVLQEFKKLSNYDDELTDELFNQIKYLVENNDRDGLTQMMKISVNMTHIECAKSVCSKFSLSAQSHKEVEIGKDVEKALREYLWLSHGHTGQYGDDGEMQCQACCQYHCIDYKREPLAKIIETAIIANRDVGILKLKVPAGREVSVEKLAKIVQKTSYVQPISITCCREIATAIKKALESGGI